MTLISHKHKFVFLANPKCASTSIHEFLRPYSDKAFTISVYQKPLGTHAYAKEVKRYLEKRNYKWEDYFVFTTLRNPLNRIKSCYYYERDFWQNKDPIDLFIRTPKDFKKYVLGNWYNRRFIDINRFTSDNNGINIVNKIIKVEDIDVEMPIILKQIGIPVNWKDLEKKNISKKTNKVAFDDEMIEHVKKTKPNDCSYYEM
ncbi:MAG: sulfotransferase family 2 domain-containing protein [Bacteroidetes bacterium]|nr:sulfotransferase family 2 domain-containing protein [Bacteroidota bacterium]